MMMLQFNGLAAEMTRATTQVIQPGTTGIHRGRAGAGFPGWFSSVAQSHPEKAEAREETTEQAQSFVVGDIVVDSARRMVTRDGAEIRVGKLSYDLLILLICESPAVVSRETIASRLWNQRYVSPETVRQRVKLLRKALNDDPANPRYVTVVRGLGYRLSPAVRRGDTSSWRRPGKRQPSFAVAGFLVLVALAAITVSDTVSVSATSGTEDLDNNAIAVLPIATEIVAALANTRVFAGGDMTESQSKF